MKVRTTSILTAATVVICAGAGMAQAASLWRGVAVVTNRTATSACMAEYDIGESYIVEYRPNLGSSVSETMVVLGEHGAYLISSLPADADKTLRSGGVSISGAAYARAFQTNVASQPLNITPATITSSTINIGIGGTLKNAGIAGCNVTFKASLLPIFDGPL
ncbi:MAG: hypothetical protein KDK89_07520 [Alphaproteobacteria bacterium]|nr:hypothetical protein [Alphaproteobacteria bacterium]